LTAAQARSALAKPGRQKHVDAFKFQSVTFGEFSAVSDAGGILLIDPHKRAIFYASILKHEYVTNQPPNANSAFHPSGVGK